MTIQWSDLDGFTTINSLIPDTDLPLLIDEAERLFERHGRRPAGVRRAIANSEVFRELAASQTCIEPVSQVIGAGAFVVRSILFDKTPEANWDVNWHQDTTIAVEERQDIPGFGPWSVKSDTPHTQPPASVLEGMMTLRLHLDQVDSTNGPLLVRPGSHRDGIREQPISTNSRAAVACTTPAGGAVMMRPLIFHASRKATAPSHRRVLHLEYAATPLPSPLQWTSA